MRVSKQELVSALADQLKPLLKKPEWADYVKTGVYKERPPLNSDWWYMRASSILLKVDKLGPVGVSKLRTKYGGKKNRGVRPERFYKGSGSIIRMILQQLEGVGLLKQETRGSHKGRVLTLKAYSLIARTARAYDNPRLKHASKAQVRDVSEKEEPGNVKPGDVKVKKPQIKKEAVEKTGLKNNNT